MTVVRLGHVNFGAQADVIESLRRFYVEVIGLREGPRPRFGSGSSGHWLYAGEHDVIRKVLGDLTSAGVDCDEDKVREALRNKEIEARRQIIESTNL